MKIRVIPGAKKFAVFYRDGIAVVKVRSPPEKGKANAEVEKELSRLLNAKIRVCKGLKSREKEIISEELGDALESAFSFCAGVAKPGQKSKNQL